MTAAWFLGAAASVPQDESVVRSTLDPIRTDPESAQDTDAPDFNERQADVSGELTGLSPRMKADDTVESVMYTPGWLAIASNPLNYLVDRQVSTSGTAAAREERGEQGHGTMFYEQALEPVVRDGSAFGNDYFTSSPMNVQEGAGLYMTPPDQDNWLSSVAQQAAEDNSRKAFQSSLYASFLS